MTKPAIFISSSREGAALAAELAGQLRTAADVKLSSEGAFHVTKPVAESLTEVADSSDFAVFVLMADDMPKGRESGWLTLGFEIGIFSGRLGMSRVFVVVGDGSPTLRMDVVGMMHMVLSTSDLPDVKAAITPVARVIRRAVVDIGPRQDRPVEAYSCFISYSWKDEGFAERLHDDLQAVGVRCWLDAKEIKIGDRWIDQIDKAIQASDKVLLVLSQASVQSHWVRQEVTTALQLEDARQETVLFPIRLDDSVFELPDIPEIDRLKKKQIGDFRKWQDKGHYQRAFSQLVRDLAISASVESRRRS
jgi:TIR domain/CAP12/Pycsar effector protein, TIR domain